MKTPPKSPEMLREQHRLRLKRQAIRLLRRTKQLADKTGVDLSAWEGEFLGSVEERIKTYGRAFADPDKGGRGSAFSVRQNMTLKQITAKARGETAKPRDRRR